VLDNPLIWEASRIGLDAIFGLYRRRLALLRDWGVLAESPAVLDVGCGIGQYAEITDGPYVGLDLNRRYIEHARRRRHAPNRRFDASDVTLIHRERDRFDLVIMVDFLHHLTDEQCVDVLAAPAVSESGHLASFEPISEQHNAAGGWIVRHDRGDHMRPLADLLALYERAGLEVTEDVELHLGPIGTRAILATPKSR
jgi:SAM-dependent methyltransferase